MYNNITYQIEKLADFPFYTEGPAIDQYGNYYCTTLLGGSIIKIGTDGSVSEWANSECPNGQIILPNGDHLICDSKLGKVLRFSEHGIFLKEETSNICDGVTIEVPNDLIADSKGNLYFTDSIRHNGKVVFLSNHGEQSILIKGLDYPNGIVLSKDESQLFIAESYTNSILCFKLKEPGVLNGIAHTFSKLPLHPSGRLIDNLPDGIAFNAKGYLGIAHYGMNAIQLLSKSGEHEFTIETTLPLTSNIIFLNDYSLLVTGGFSEPGPGALIRININRS